MVYELHGVLSGAISLTTWEKVMPAYGGEPESFLNDVVTPIYEVIRKVLSNIVICPLFSFSWLYSSIHLISLQTKGSCQ